MSVFLHCTSATAPLLKTLPVTVAGRGVHSMYSNVTATTTTFKRNSAAVGGGWSSSNDTLRLEGCYFAANHAYMGGALHMSSNCTAAITSTRFANNTAVLYGGAISGIQSSNTSMVGCTFTGNSVTSIGGGGGAVHYLGAHHTVTASATRFHGNKASYGGAVASICPIIVDVVDQVVGNAASSLGDAFPILQNHSAKLYAWAALNSGISLDTCHMAGIRSSLELRQCSFKNNCASRGGGAAYIADGAGLYSSSSEFVRNTVRTGEGGGVLMESNSSLRCSNTSFRENQALRGGAVAVTQFTTASFSDGCVFSQNNATVGGGALVVDRARVVLKNSTLQQNTAQQGGGLLALNGAEVTIGQGVHLEGNTAQLFGGGMLVDYECLQQVRLVRGCSRCQWLAATSCCCAAPVAWSTLCNLPYERLIRRCCMVIPTSIDGLCQALERHRIDICARPCSLQAALPAPLLLRSTAPPTPARCNSSSFDISSGAVFTSNNAGWAGPNIYAAASWTEVLFGTSNGMLRLNQPLVSGPVAEVVVQGEGLEAYVSGDDVYLDLKVHVLDAWKQPVTGKSSAIMCGVDMVIRSAYPMLPLRCIGGPF
jgi:predicted outer membrane repeat protein